MERLRIVVAAAVMASCFGSPIELTITPDGSVDYKRLEGGIKRSVTAPIRAFRRDGFEVGALGLNTTFRIDRPPHEENGVWKMTIDGVELTRVR